MRCAFCGNEKEAHAFSGAQKKKPATTRKCALCTAVLPAAVNLKQKKREVAIGGRPTSFFDGLDSSFTDLFTATGQGANARARKCSACGTQLAGTVDDDQQDWKRCGRCKRAFYCDKACQVKHWKRGGHKQACREQVACVICLDNDAHPLPVQCGCGCRGDAGCAHVACKVAYATHMAPGTHSGWYKCPTCKQHYTGPMLLGMTEALWKRMKGRPVESKSHMDAQASLAIAYEQAGRLVEAEALYRDVLATRQRVRGPNDTDTLMVAGNLGNTLLSQHKPGAAEAVYRDTLTRQRKTLGPEHERALLTACRLSASLLNQGRYDVAEPLLRDTLATQQRTLSVGHLQTLETSKSLAWLLHETGRFAEAEERLLDSLAEATRTLGPEHPLRLGAASQLAGVQASCDRPVEAAALLTATLATMQRVCPGHPFTGIAGHRMVALRRKIAGTHKTDANAHAAQRIMQQRVSALCNAPGHVSTTNQHDSPLPVPVQAQAMDPLPKLSSEDPPVPALVA